MGWSGGTKIFDTVAEELTSIKYMYESDKLNILTSLEDVLSDKDWTNK